MTVSDDQGDTATTAQTIEAYNLPPQVEIANIPVTSPEGTAIHLTGLANDASPVDNQAGFTYAWSVTKDGIPFAAATNQTGDFSFAPDDNANYDVELTVTDKDDGSTSVDQIISVTNVAPTAAIVSIGNVRREGIAIAVIGSAADPSPVDTAAGLNYAWAVYENGGEIPYASASGMDMTNWSFLPDNNGSYEVGLTVSDKDGDSSAPTVQVVTVVPFVTGVTSSAGNGAYTLGATIPIAVTFSQPVTVNGTPKLTLNDGGVADYTGGSGTNTITFTYIVTASQNIPGLDEASTSDLSLNGGSIVDELGDPVSLPLAAPGTVGSLGAIKSIIIDTVAPTATMTAPADNSSTFNNKPTLSATASDNTGGSGLASVQFQYSSDGGSTWQNVGAAQTSSPFSFTFVTALADGSYAARAIATDLAGNSGTSAMVTFTVQTPPTVTLQPISQNVLAGTSVTFQAAGSSNPTVSWQVSTNSGATWTDIAGSATANYTVTADAAHDGGEYRAVFSNAAGSTTSDAAIVRLYHAPIFNSSSSAVFTAGHAGQFTFTTKSFPTAALSESGLLPTNVTFHDEGDGTAFLSGTPNLGTGIYTVSITASNGHNPAVTQVFTLTVVDPPTISSTSSAIFRVGTTGKFLVTATPGLPTMTTVAVAAGTLPTWLKLTAGASGMATLTGIPPRGSAGIYHFTLIARNGPNSQTTQAFTLTVNQVPSFTSEATAALVVNQMGTITVTTGGTPTAALSVGALPSFLTFHDNGNGTASLSGTPIATGTFTIKLGASNDIGTPATQTLIVTVCQPPAVSVTGSASLVVGQSGKVTFTASGGLPNRTAFSINGTLPKGVTFKDNKNGTATLGGLLQAGTAGSYPVVVIANNGPAGTAVSLTAKAVTLTINQAPAFASPATALLVVNQPGSITVTTSSTPSATLSVVDMLPSFLTFHDNGDGTATLSGTPTATGSYLVKLSASNGVGTAAIQTLTVTADRAPTVSVSGSTTFMVGTASTVRFTASGGIPAATVFSISGTLPRGVTFKDNKNGTANLGGTPLAGSGGSYAVTVRANNGPAGTTLAQAATPIMLTVNQTPAFSSAAAFGFLASLGGSFNVTTSGMPTPTLTVVGTLPSFLAFQDNHNGTATLTATVAAAGSYLVKLSASNGVGTAAIQTLTVTADRAPTVSVSGSTTFMVGTASTVRFTASGGIPAATVFSISGTLPRGVTFKDNKNGTATLGGTPLAGSGGSYAVTVKANNGPAGTTLAQAATPIMLTVNQTPAFSSSKTAAFTIGQQVSFIVTTSGVPTAKLSTTALPAGLNFQDNGDGTATISGTPQPGSANNYIIQLTASEGPEVNIQQILALTVSQPPVITSANNTTFTHGQLGSFIVLTAGFPKARLIMNGTRPSGMIFTDNKDGTATLEGRPKALGTFTFTISAGNGVTPTAYQVFTLSVA